MNGAVFAWIIASIHSFIQLILILSIYFIICHIVGSFQLVKTSNYVASCGWHSNIDELWTESLEWRVWRKPQQVV